MKGNACERIGMKSMKIELPQATSTTDLLKTIQKLNDNEEVSGILLQHPTPSQINERFCFDAIKLNKEVSISSKLLLQRAKLKEKLGLPRAAIIDYEKSIELNPNLFNTYYLLSHI